MDKRRRVQAALQGEAVEPIPLSLWRHFHCRDRAAQGLAEATLALASAYDLDLVKITPCGLYAVEDWAGGQVAYPGTEHNPPSLHTPAVTTPAGWRRLVVLRSSAGALGRKLEAIRLIVAGLGGETPCMMTVFSPLTLAFKLAGRAVIDHLREYPADLHDGLEILAETTSRFANAALSAGADGLFFATQMASYRWLTRTEYEAFGEPYDLMVLDAVAGRSALTVLHLHGRDVFFDLACEDRYPIHAVSWHNQETSPSLLEARQRTDRAFVTGLDRELLERGPPAAIRSQVYEALAHTKGQGLILAPSCVIPTTTPVQHLWAVREAVSSWG